MRYLRWAPLILALCFGVMACVTTVEAAQTGIAKDEKNVSTRQGATKTKKVKKAESKNQADKKKGNTQSIKEKKGKTSSPNIAQSIKDTQSAKGENDKNTKAMTAKSGKTKKKRSDKKNQISDRDIWMQRALGNSKLLGKASWYGSSFHGSLTASGVEYDMHTYTAAHRTLPMGTVVEVTDEDSGRSVMVCINNRGPFKPGRIIDLSYAAAHDLGIKSRGVAEVNLRVISNAQGQPLNSDEAFYVQWGHTHRTQDAKAGPFSQYADASVMKELLRNQYPDAAIVLGPAVASN